MITSRLAQKSLLTLMLSLPAVGVCQEFLGFDVGTVSREEIARTLKQSGALFTAEKPVASAVAKAPPPVIIYQYTGLDEIAPTRSAILSFDENQVLNKVEVTFKDSGKTFDHLKARFDAEFNRPVRSLYSMDDTHEYRKGDAVVTLESHHYGMNSQGTVRAVYTTGTDQPEPALAMLP